jgi:HEAT repeat protein
MPEIVLYPSAQMFSRSPLAAAITAAKSGDWPAVAIQLRRHLDHLDQGDQGSQGDQVSGDVPRWEAEERVIVLDLAIDLLLEAEFQERWEAAKLFARIGDPAIPSLIDLIQNTDLEPDARWFGVRILADLQSPDSIPALLALLAETPETDLQTMAITALAQLGPQVIPQIQPLTQGHPRLAAQVLSLLRHSHTIPSLLELAQDRDPAIRTIAIEALGSFHDPEIAQTLNSALQDFTASVRIAAVKGIGFQAIGSVDWTTALAPLLQDLNPEVCRQTALALSRIGTLDAAQILHSALYQYPEIGLEILRAISWIDLPETMAFLSDALGRDRLPIPIRQEAARLLGRSSHTQASNLLETQLPQAPRELQSTIVTALGQLGQRSAQAILIEAIAQANGHLRLHILAALKNIDPSDSHHQLQKKALTSASPNNFQLALQEWS